MGWRPGLLLTCAAAFMLPAPASAAIGFVPAETLPAAGAADSGVKIAMAPNGFAIAGWVESLSGSQTAIRVATRPPGGPWSAPQQLDLVASPVTQVRYLLSVAIDNAGDGAIAWDDEHPGSPTVDAAVVATKVAAQSSFGAPQSLAGAADPVVGIDSAGHVTMIDEELDGASTDEVDRVWPAGVGPPATRSDLVATGCRPDLTPAVLAVAPSGDAIAGAECHGDTFIRRVSGTWHAGTTPISDTSSAGSCPISPPTAVRGGEMTVAIDGAGDVAGAFVVDNSSTDCTTFITSDSDSLHLVLGSSTGVAPVSPAVDTSFTQDFTTGSAILTPTVAVAPGSVLLGWRNGGFISTSDKIAQFDPSGQPRGAQTLVTTTVGGAFDLAMNGSGAALVAFPTTDGTQLQAELELPGAASFGAPVPLAPAPAATPSVAIDGAGDGAAAYDSGQAASAVAQVRGLDANPPTLGGVTIPSAAVAGAQTTFTAEASDMWGPVTVSWDFDDGSALVTGTSVTHTFTRVGTRTVAVTVSDAIGNALTDTVAETVAASTPVLSKASVRPNRFKAGHRAVFTFTLNEPASVSIAIARRRHAKHGKPRFNRVGARRTAGVEGINHLRFSGRIGRRKLAPGRYRATITATAGHTNSKPVALSFTILRAG
jgi:PKD repeat protein